MIERIAKSRAALLAIIFASAALGAGAVVTVDRVAAASEPVAGRGAMERVVRDYLLANPEILPEAMGVLKTRRVATEIAANRPAIVKPYGSAWIGNPNGDVTIVEYFDYNCGFCRASLPTIDRLVASDPGVRIVFRELPILSAESRTAAGLSLVAAEKGKFRAFHDALYAAGPITNASLTHAVVAAGLDPRAAQLAAQAPKVASEIDTNLAVAGRLEMSGTPSWVIGDRVFSTILSLEQLQAAVAVARAGQKAGA